MNKAEITTFLESFQNKLDRTIVIIDFGNVDKWKENLRWRVGIQELAILVKKFSIGNKQMRRFYYGSDYGSDNKSNTLTLWSGQILQRANMNRFEVVTKRVKYIHNLQNPKGFDKKCDLDVEMAVDLIRFQDDYDNIILFSGDGDMHYVLRYLKDEFNKVSYVFAAREHIGREIIDGVKEGIIDRIIYVEDFEYRLNMNRFKK
jgi:uncharacterized LabA/DUF88 family protein